MSGLVQQGLFIGVFSSAAQVTLMSHTNANTAGAQSLIFP
jgi:hypothetical protein